MPKPRKVIFDTLDFEFVHGHSPRGRGNWAFFFNHTQDVADEANVFWSRGYVTYTDAKGQARAEAVKRGKRVVYVGS